MLAAVVLGVVRNKPRVRFSLWTPFVGVTSFGVAVFLSVNYVKIADGVGPLLFWATAAFILWDCKRMARR